MATICERVCDGIPVEMVMDTDNLLVSVRSKKQVGRRRDSSHDLKDFCSIEPSLAMEVLQRSRSFAVGEMSEPLQRFIKDTLEAAADEDFWYLGVEEENILEEVPGMAWMS